MIAYVLIGLFALGVPERLDVTSLGIGMSRGLKVAVGPDVGGERRKN
jgi:hypothetical protein